MEKALRLYTSNKFGFRKKHAKEKASYVEIEDLDRKDLISEELFEHLYLKRVTTT